MFKGSISMLLVLAAGAALIAPSSVLARTWVWPDSTQACGAGASPTLQNCINGATAGDTILIGTPYATLGPWGPGSSIRIGENISINKSITIAAYPGWDAIFAPGYSIRIAIAAPYLGTAANVTLSRLYMDQGHITINHTNSASTTYSLNGIRITDVDGAASPNCAISFSGTGTGLAVLDIGFGEVDFTTPSALGAASGICANGQGGNWRADVYSNRFNASSSVSNASAATAATAISMTGGNAGTVWIENNQIHGSYTNGVVANLTGTSPSLWIHDNIATGMALGFGIEALTNSASAASSTVVNNTVVQNAWGLVVEGSANGGSTVAANNLIANNTYGFYPFGSSDDHNLIFGNANLVTPSASDVTTNPLLRSNADPRPMPGSPALAAANLADVVQSYALFLPAEDADGNLRVINSHVDIGAIEFSTDFNGTTTMPPNSGYLAPISTPASVTLPSSENLLLTPVITAANVAANTWGPALSWWGVYWGGPGWDVYNDYFGEYQSGATNFGGDTFDIFAPSSIHNFTQLATSANTNATGMTLSDSTLNGVPGAIAFVTHVWTGRPGYDANPLGLYYNNQTSNWQVVHTNTMAVVPGYQYNVVVAPPINNAFTVSVAQPVAALAGTAQSVVFLYNPALDNNPCAAPMVTQSNTTGSLTYTTGGQRYSYDQAWGVEFIPSPGIPGSPPIPGQPGHWAIVAAGPVMVTNPTGNSGNPGTASFPSFAPGTSFNVLVDGAKADSCRW